MIDDRCFTFTNGYEHTLNFVKKQTQKCLNHNTKG